MTDMEKFYLWVIRKNQDEKKTEIRKELRFGRLKIVFSWRSRRNLWGRFGGGWNWKLGVQIGRGSAILSLLICEISIALKPVEE